MTILRGNWRLATKINRTFFVENEVLNIFNLTIFSKINVFQNNLKNNFWRRKEALNDKNEYEIFGGNGVSNTVFKCFPQKTPYRLNGSQKTCFGRYIFPVILLGRLFLKIQGSPKGGPVPVM